MNGDVLSNVELRRLLLFHRRAGGTATMAVKDYEMTVPYGVINVSDQNEIVDMVEKPAHRFFINAGIYALSPNASAWFPAISISTCPRCSRHARRTT